MAAPTTLPATADPASSRSGRRPRAVVTGASSGIGLEMARCCAQHGLDLVIAADRELTAAKQSLLMQARHSGRMLISGSIAGFMPGSFQAVCNGTKVFIDSFSWAPRNELKDSGVTVTCLMPGPTDTDFFDRADMMDTDVGTGSKADPADVARVGFKAMRDGERDVVAGLKNTVQVALASVMPSAVLAEQHRKMAEPGSAS